MLSVLFFGELLLKWRLKKNVADGNANVPVSFAQGWAGFRKYSLFDPEASGAWPPAEAHCHWGAWISERHHRILVRLISHLKLDQLYSSIVSQDFLSEFT